MLKIPYLSHPKAQASVKTGKITRQTQNSPEKTRPIQKTAFGLKLADQVTDSLKKLSKTKTKQTKKKS